ncbi:efflux RND transporter permease subunit [Sessilibacter corallicola]|uniref:efflux RND transporter permease subunit n=1 Tax=Sessilibacter corallicola TaxID=2904075 RepID=UPI001E629E48|nr:efflux RND transporter permease subunit [Sessilibacter corallicola]MCE2030310.1 efflux RND transporter permease subunit [Sessilibacter corallicola]
MSENTSEQPQNPNEHNFSDADFEDSKKGLIGYFAHNSVAANLLMVAIIILGIFAFLTVQRQMFPNTELNTINVTANYPGTSPQEIEESILVKIEESLKDVTEIDKSISRSYRGTGTVTLEIDSDADLAEVLDKVKLRVDGVATFPAAMEPILVSQQEFQQSVIEISVVGDLPLYELKPFAEEIRDELLQQSNVSLVNVFAPEYEIAIEIDPDTLRKYNLTISDVTQSIRNYSTNISAGELRTDSGLISVRIENQSYRGEDFRDIPVKIGENGAKVLLSDVANIRDEFEEGQYYFQYSGVNAIHIDVNATKEQSIGDVAGTVKRYIEQKNATLPQGVEIKVLVDLTYYLDARLDMMLENLLLGAILVAIMLSIFLRIKLAFWVMLGLPVCFLGALLFMPAFDVTINIVSLFAFIMVLGIVVDDAIVIGESVYTQVEKTGGGVVSVVRGTRKVATPATFGVLTTMAVFAPFTLSSGPDSARFVGIAVVAILCLFFSLIESKLILPAHLAHTKFAPEKPDSWRSKFNAKFMNFINVRYRGFLEKCLNQRWTAISLILAFFIVSISLLSSNLVRFIPIPQVPHDFPSIKIEMNENVSDEAIISALNEVEDIVWEVEKENIETFGRGMVRDVLAFNEGRVDGQIVIPLVDEELRDLTAFDLARQWREKLPEIPGLRSITILDDVNDQGDGSGEIGYLFYGENLDELNTAGREFMDLMRQIPGIYDVSSTIDPVGKEVQLRLLPVAYDLGLSLADIANQVGVSFYGGEAQRVIRDGDEIRVMVRYPELTRSAYSSLKYTVIRTPNGREVMLGDVVTLVETPGISYIRREEGFRSVYVGASIDEQVIEPGEAGKQVREKVLPVILDKYPDVKTQLGGDLEDQQQQQLEQMAFAVAAMLLVYILLAIPLKSYVQPLIIMSVIPFSIIGALWGHYILGLDLSMMSTFGLIAAAGVVVNDSLVLTDYINQLRAQGVATRRAVIEAGCARFRAITLTSITTFAGVMPIMFETSLQAQFVIPMAVALGSSVLFATVLTLIMVPCLYLVFQDIGSLFKSRKGVELSAEVGI